MYFENTKKKTKRKKGFLILKAVSPNRKRRDSNRFHKYLVQKVSRFTGFTQIFGVVFPRAFVKHNVDNVIICSEPKKPPWKIYHSRHRLIAPPAVSSVLTISRPTENMFVTTMATPLPGSAHGRIRFARVRLCAI